MNIQVLNSLPAATKAGGIPAYLETPTGRINFLYNPESKKYARQAQYAEASTGGTEISEQNYVRTGGRTLELDNLLLDSFAAGRSLKPLLKGLEKLLLPVELGLAPPTVLFVWGSERFGPAQVSQVSWEEAAWLSGEPAQARVSLSLIQIPTALTVSPTPSPTGETNLTDRQREDGRNKASDWLSSNVNKLRTEVRSAYNSNRFKFLTDQVGNISILDDKDIPFGKVGTWDGFEFKPLDELTR